MYFLFIFASNNSCTMKQHFIPTKNHLPESMEAVLATCANCTCSKKKDCCKKYKRKGVHCKKCPKLWRKLPNSYLWNYVPLSRRSNFHLDFVAGVLHVEWLITTNFYTVLLSPNRPSAPSSTSLQRKKGRKYSNNSLRNQPVYISVAAIPYPRIK